MDSQNSQQIGVSEANPNPTSNKTWDELTTDEKVERMRIHVKTLEDENVRLKEEIGFLNNHTHNANGVMEYRFKAEDKWKYLTRGNQLGMLKVPGSKVWF